MTADLRKMGRSDIVVAEHDTNTLGVLLSNRDGTFQPEQELTVFLNPDFVTVLDVNGDGFPDIVGGGIGCADVFCSETERGIFNLLLLGRVHSGGIVRTAWSSPSLSGGYPPIARR
ncbi:MAG: VCBS repeat-containing protein [Edaphobacter sp.]